MKASPFLFGFKQYLTIFVAVIFHIGMLNTYLMCVNLQLIALKIMGKTGNCLFRLILIVLASACGLFAIACLFAGEIAVGCIILFLAIVLFSFFVSHSKKAKNETAPGLSWKETLFMPAGKVFNIDTNLVQQVITNFKDDRDSAELRQLLDMKSESQKRDTLVYAYQKLIKEYLQNGSLSEEEGGRIIYYFTEVLKIDISVLAKEKEYSYMCKLIVINCLLNGKLPTNIRIDIGEQFLNMEEGELVIADQKGATYSEILEKRTHYGISSGSTISLGRGRYSRFGSFWGTEKVSQDIVIKGEGTLLLTNMNIYFLSNQKTVKFPYDKILSYSAYSDGLGIHLSDSRRRPVIIGRIDGWFVYNVVTNVRNLSKID